MSQKGHKGDDDAHCNEDDGDFGQAAPCKSADLRVGGVLERSDRDEGDPRCLKDKNETPKNSAVAILR